MRRGDGDGVAAAGYRIAGPEQPVATAHCFDTLGANTQGSGRSGFRIRYHDPQQGRRQVFNGRATWRVLPGYNGYNAVNGPGEANDDVAIIRIPGTFRRTTYEDYLRVYAADGGSLQRKLHFFGGGIHSYSGRSDNNLRHSMFEVENVENHHIVLDNRKKVTLCQGDSGGPFT